MKKIIFICLLAGTIFSYGQSSTPFMLMETGMHTGKIYTIYSDTAGKYLLTGCRDKTARFWDASTGALLRTLRIPIGNDNEGRIYTAALSVSGKIAAIAGTTGKEWDSTFSIYIISTQTGDIIHRINNLPNGIKRLDFSPDGKWLIAGLYGSYGLRVFDTEGWNEIKKLNGYITHIESMVFKPGGGLITGGFDGKLRLYDADLNLLKEKDELSAKSISSISMQPGGKMIALGFDDKAVVELRDANDLSLLYSPVVTGADKYPDALDIVSFSSDGQSLYAGGTFRNSELEKYKIRCWREGGKGAYRDLTITENVVMDMKPLPDGVMAIAGHMPEIAVINKEDAVIWYKATSNNQYNIHNRDHFKLNDIGTAIGFTPMYHTAMSFDVTQRKLTEENPAYSSPVASNGGTTVTNWQSKQNLSINDKRVSFQEEEEMFRSVDVNAKGNLAVLGTNHHIYLADRNANLVWSAKTNQSAWAIKISADNKIITAALDDGTIRWYSARDGRELLAFYLHSDQKRWVLFTPSGYYDASIGAEDFIGWHVNNGPDKTPYFYPGSRFREQFYRPDIIDSVLLLGNEKEGITAANRVRNKSQNIPAQADITQKPPPTISISNPASGSTFSGNMVSVSYTINSPGDAPPKNFKVLVNGRPVATERGVIIKYAGSQKIDVNIPPEDCTITLLADNDNGTSPEANLLLKWKAPENTRGATVSKPNLYILAIGISEYDNPDYKLGLAAKDAGDFAAAVEKQKGKMYNNVYTKTLREKDASKINILNGLQWIGENTTATDVAIIFFAGHGINDNNGVYYMLPADADIGHLRATCINFEEIKQIQSSIQGKVLVFIDACHSGNVMGAGGTNINGLVNLLTSTVKGAGAITFTSSTGKEYSLEDPNWGNGAFTKALVEGLNGAAAVDDDKEITYTALSLYISRRVKKLTSDKQHPTLVPTPNTPDFPIAVKE